MKKKWDREVEKNLKWDFVSKEKEKIECRSKFFVNLELDLSKVWRDISCI